LDRDRYTIKIDLITWQELELDYRNLLFWYEVARIQQHSVKSFRWEAIVFAAGLGMSLLEVTSQHVLLLGVYLLLTTVAGWQLYHHNRGGDYLRSITQADRGAILLAQQFGYSQPKAYRSLYRAIRMLLAQSPQGWLAKQYQTRLQVLEISAIENRKKRQHSTQISRGKTNAIIS
jgi:hypothetical protein